MVRRHSEHGVARGHGPPLRGAGKGVVQGRLVLTTCALLFFAIGLSGSAAAEEVDALRRELQALKERVRALEGPS
jgi:hypothetical protein